ncbi:MAG: DUF4870 domain-containing protein [Pirellulales bacterium]|nr:DUF4870 domain-containing protein [Pirellulales bacterium]
MSLSDELQKLQQLHQSGALSDEEFAQAKAKLLNQQPGSFSLFSTGGANPATEEEQTRQWGMFLHLSLLAGFVVPMAGLIVPIVIWQLKKTELPGIDEHGKNAVNWLISEVIYLVVCILLSFFIIGLPLLIALLVVGVVFPIMAGVKASNGEVWKYPLAIPFFNVPCRLSP